MKNYSPRILIAGANGQLGTALCQHPLAKERQLILCSRDEMDITSLSSVQRALATYSPDMIINAAAYTAVDKAEQENEQCLQVNHLGTQHLAIACQKNQLPLIHVSTDYIYDGSKSTPYREEDAVNPINFYGKTKWLGEQAIREVCEQYIILRVSGVFSEYGNNFFKTIVRLAKEKKELRIVADQITCPTYAGDIARVIYTLAKNPTHWGTYHYCANPPVSWYQFASAIIAAIGKQESLAVEKVHAITTAEYPTLAKRPAYSVLDCSKIAKDYNVKQASWEKHICHINHVHF